MTKNLKSKKIYSKKLNSIIKANKFDIKKYISYKHNQDCCEKVYIDFEHMDLTKSMVKQIGDISKIEIWTAPEDWIIFYVYNDKKERYWIFLPCRNEQNWYYNDRLNLIINIKNEETIIELQWKGAIKNIIH